MVMDREASSWALQRVQEVLNCIGTEYVRPSVVFRAKVTQLPDGWLAYIGEIYNLGATAVGFSAKGKTPDEAMRNFDIQWYKEGGGS